MPDYWTHDVCGIFVTTLTEGVVVVWTVPVVLQNATLHVLFGDFNPFGQIQEGTTAV